MKLGAGARWDIFRRDGFRCHYCGRTQHDEGVVLVIDHIIPLAHGGTHDPENLTTACRDCNGGKSDKLLDPPQPRAKRRPRQPRPEPIETTHCVTRLWIATRAAQGGDSYETVRRRIAAQGYPTPPQQKTDRDWVAAVTPENQRAASRAIGELLGL